MTKAPAVVGGGAAGLVPRRGQTVGLRRDTGSVTVLLSQVEAGWRLTLVGALEEEQLWRCRICR